MLLSGGFETWTIPPETDPVNFATHVRQPVLMVNGRVGLVELGSTFFSPQTRIISGACPPPAPSVWYV